MTSGLIVNIVLRSDVGINIIRITMSGAIIHPSLILQRQVTFLCPKTIAVRHANGFQSNSKLKQRIVQKVGAQYGTLCAKR